MSNCIMIKICVLGTSTVGKTSIASRFVQDTFDPFASPTLGASFLSRFVSTPNETLYKLQIWDTAGQERYKALTPLYYRGASAVLIVYDLTNRTSFTRGVFEWVEELKDKGPPNVLIVLVGNKHDLGDSSREVQEEEAQQYAKKIGALFYETSAKSGHNINNVFTDLCVALEENKSNNLVIPAIASNSIVKKEEFSPKYTKRPMGRKSTHWKFGNGKRDWNKKESMKYQKTVQLQNEEQTNDSKCCME